MSEIENEHSPGKAATLRALQIYFENRGLEFLDGDGVRRNQTGLRHYQGAREFREFYDDIYETIKKEGREICLFNGVPELLTKWLGEDYYMMHAKRMEKIKANFDFRVMIEESDRNFIVSGFAVYRWFPAKLFHDRTIYVYGSKVGIITFRDDDVRVVVIDQADFAASQRILFNIAWEHVAREVQE